MSVLLRRVALRNFKSIAECKVDLGDLTVLVGPNGSGKSNFIDALRLVSESLSTTLEYAIRQRGGISEVRRRSGGHPSHFAISLRINLGRGKNANFAFQVGARPEGEFHVQHEQAMVSTEGLTTAFYEIKNGEIKRASDDLTTSPEIVSDRLFLNVASGVRAFRPLYDALSSMGFYNINPAEIRELQPHDRGDLLDRTGRNLAAVIRRLSADQPNSLERIQQYLRQIVPGIEGVEHKGLGPRETLEFRQTVQGQKYPWRFYAAAMSDGTLRSLGVLTALFQFKQSVGAVTPLIAIEEPESTVHPGAAAIIMDALLEASKNEQVLLTTHSPDLLNHNLLRSENILSVRNLDGKTFVAPVDKASVSVIKERLYTPGELLRENQLQQDEDVISIPLKQTDLFERI